jgi:hypothetical protein
MHSDAVINWTWSPVIAGVTVADIDIVLDLEWSADKRGTVSEWSIGRIGIETRGPNGKWFPVWFEPGAHPLLSLALADLRNDDALRGKVEALALQAADDAGYDEADYRRGLRSAAA